MENKISISAISSMLAETSGKNRKFCEDFVKEFFRLISESLEQGENVRIKGFGNFKLVDVDSRASVNVSTGERNEIAAHKKVVFTPSKEMATLINAPFEVFESVEIDDSIPTELIEESFGVEPLGLPADSPKENMEEKEEKNLLEPEPATEEISPLYESSDYVLDEEKAEDDEKELTQTRLEEGSVEEEEDDELTYEAYMEVKQDRPVFESVTEDSGLTENEENEENEEIMEDKGKYRRGFFAGAMTTLTICLLIFMLGCFFSWWPVNFGSVQEKLASHEANEMTSPAVSEDPEETEAIETPAEEEKEKKETVSEPVVYDTVTTTRYLTTIAREHYGNFNFWPYIYIENEKFLGHPDRIKPGTKVVVPKLSKYGINPSRKSDIEAAKKKSMEIYARFK